MQAIHLAAMDMDGTLLDDRKEVSPATLRALEALREKGIPAAFSTGRALSEVTLYPELTGLILYAILASGALVMDLRAGTVIRKDRLPAEIALKALELACSGHISGNAACSRLYAYTLFSLYRSDREKTADAMRILQALIRRGDNIAKCLYALIGLDQPAYAAQESGEYLRLMEESAQQGCAVAQYYFGRWLFDGQMGLRNDEQRGMDFLMQAVQQDFAPALLYLKNRMENRDNRFQYSAETIAMLETELNGFNKTKIAEAIVMAI